MCADRHKELKLAEITCTTAQTKLAELSLDALEIDTSLGREWKIKADKHLDSEIKKYNNELREIKDKQHEEIKIDIDKKNEEKLAKYLEDFENSIASSKSEL